MQLILSEAGAPKQGLLYFTRVGSTEAEFMGACDAAKVILYVRSILWDLAFNTSLMMPPPQWRMPKPKATPRTRHMDIRFFALLIHERVDTSMNMADHFSMQLPPTFFARHVDHILGHIPPPYSPQTISLLELSTTLPSTLPLIKSKKLWLGIIQSLNSQSQARQGQGSIIQETIRDCLAHISFLLLYL